jgi:anti-anti-sigma factor
VSEVREPPANRPRISTRRHARLGVCCVSLEGEHDVASAGELREALLDVRPSETLIIDLTACRFIDSSVIAQLLFALRRHPHLRVVVPDEASLVARALRVTGVYAVLNATTSLEPLVDTS